jgi:hypothetical protein
MASLFRKLSNYRPKSRSKSPTKQQTSANFGGELEKPSSATTANHVDASFKEDGWIGRNSTTTKDEFGSSSPFQSPTRNSSNHVAAAKWNPAKGRFESPKRVPSTKGRSNDVFTRPSGYLTHDGIVSDGQIPSSSVSPVISILMKKI